jgi:hypothetical protein
MLIDCDRCSVRGDACADCVVSALFPDVDPGLDWDETEWRALCALADAGLVPRPRLAAGRVPAEPEAPAPLPVRDPVADQGAAFAREIAVPWPAPASAQAQAQARVRAVRRVG